jgi:hypothetical protein
MGKNGINPFAILFIGMLLGAAFTVIGYMAANYQNQPEAVEPESVSFHIEDLIDSEFEARGFEINILEAVSGDDPMPGTRYHPFGEVRCDNYEHKMDYEKFNAFYDDLTQLIDDYINKYRHPLLEDTSGNYYTIYKLEILATEDSISPSEVWWGIFESELNIFHFIKWEDKDFGKPEIVTLEAI